MKRTAVKCVIIVMLLLFGILGFLYYGSNRKTRARLILHAGASLYLDINEAGQVICAAPNNEAGANLLKDLELKRVSLDTALEILGRALHEKGIQKRDKAPFVAVSRMDEEEAAWLKTRVETKMLALMEDYGKPGGFAPRVEDHSIPDPLRGAWINLIIMSRSLLW